MMRKYLLPILLLCFTVASGQNLNEIEKEIKGLKGESVEQYWNKLFALDQANAALNGEPSKAVEYLYEAVLMVHYHGYPKNKTYGSSACSTPWLTWVHCGNAALTEYTFPIILQGRDIQELPEGRFPNYFVGGYLLQVYGLDMEFDTDFHTGGLLPINKALYKLEEERHKIDIEKMKALTEDAFKLLNIKKNDIIGSWEIVQHGDKSTYTIFRNSKDYYLNITLGEGRYASTRKIKPSGKNKGRFELEQGYGLYHFVMTESNLELRDANSKTIKTLTQIKQ